MITLAAADTLAAGASVASQLTITVFGMELNAGVEAYKVLDQRQLASSPATIYTVPASTQAFIRTIMVNNNDTAPRTFRLFRGGTAASNAITPDFTLLPGGSAMYEDGLGWQFFNKNGQLLTAYGSVPDQSFVDTGMTGFLAESIPRMICPEVNSTIPTASGTLFMQGIPINAGTLVSNISFWSATTAANTPTHWMFGLFDINRNLLASTADMLTTAWASNTLKTLPVTTPYLVSTAGIYYCGIFVTATTIPTMKGGTAKTGGHLSGGVPILHGATTNTGLTTAMPNPAATITPSTQSAWCGIS